MRVRWTTDAADDLERISDYIAKSRPESARRVAQSVVERIGTLECCASFMAHNDGRLGSSHASRTRKLPRSIDTQR